MPTKEEYDAMNDNELKKYASTLPLTYDKNWSRTEKDLYNAIQRRDYKLRKQGKTFEYVPKLGIPAKGSSTASELPTERQMTEEKAKQILSGALKFKLAKNNVADEARYLYVRELNKTLPPEFQIKIRKENIEQRLERIRKEKEAENERYLKREWESMIKNNRDPPSNQRFRPDY